MPTADQLTRHRTVLSASLVDTCTIQRRTPGNDGKGGRPFTYSNLAMNVPCRLAPGTFSIERTQGDKMVSVFDAIVTLAYNADVIETDRIIWNSRTFEVTKARPRTTQISLRVEAKEIK